MRRILILLALLSLLPLKGQGQISSTLTLNEGTVINPAPTRTGLNIAEIDNYDSGQILKNLVGLFNPAFEPLLHQQIWALDASYTTTSFVVPFEFDTVPQNYWVGATATIVQSQNGGAELGCSSTITANTGQVNIVSGSAVGTTATIITATASNFVPGTDVYVQNVTGSATWTNDFPVGTIASVSGTTVVVTYINAPTGTITGGIMGQIGNNSVTVSPACASPGFQQGDVVIMKRKDTTTPESMWEASNGGVSNTSSGGGKLLSDNANLCATCGIQALQMNGATGTSSFSIFFDATQQNIFVMLNGTYQLSFWAKSISGTPVMHAGASRGSSGGFSCGTYTPTLTTTWTLFQFTCTTSETQATTAIGPGSVAVSVTGGTADIDNIAFQQTGTDPTNTTVFRDQVINDIKAYHPYTLRYWVNQNSEDALNWTAQPYARQPSVSGRSYWDGPAGGGGYQLGIGEFLQVAQLVGAQPYIEIPVTLTPTDAANLTDFLAGSTGTTYGARRAALGQAATWTSVFPHIYLSFCNECWNGTFIGQALPDRTSQPNIYVDYALRSNTINSAFRATASYPASGIQLGFDAQTANNNQADSEIAIAKPDYIEIENYTYGFVNLFSTDSALWQPYMVEPYDMVVDPNDPSNFFQSTTDYTNLHACGASGTALCQLNIYEAAAGTISGSVDQTHEDYVNAGGGYGVVAAFQFPLRQQKFPGQFVSMTYFGLTEYLNGGSNSNEAKLWGNVVDEGGATNNKRPQFYSLSLANQSIIGPMYSCTLNSTNLYNFPAEGTPNPTPGNENGNGTAGWLPALNNVPYVFSFCYMNGTQRSILLVNTDLTTSHIISFAGTNVPTGTVTERIYAPTNLDDLNEASGSNATNHTAATVGLSQTTLTNPTTVTLPAHSAIALDFTTGVAPTNGGSFIPHSVAVGRSIFQ